MALLFFQKTIFTPLYGLNSIMQVVSSIEVPSNIYHVYRTFIKLQKRSLRKYKKHHVKEWDIHRNEPGIIGRIRRNLYQKAIGERHSESPCVLLVNRDTASAGETAVSFARSIPRFVIVGENTAGCCNLGNLFIYYLPNSLIKIQLASSITFRPDYEEGIGFLPDYWLDSSDPIRDITDWLSVRTSYRFRLTKPQSQL